MITLTRSRRINELKEEEEALQRWEGEGGSPCDSFGVLDRIQAQLEPRREDHLAPIASASTRRASWPGWTGGPYGRLTPPPRVHRDAVGLKDLSNPADRGFGFYLIQVPAWDYSQLIRASHATAARVARSRTQYGDTELRFLESIDTPALD
jgi:hypothetical protein